ncbi:MAG: hypothetical protein ACK45B_07730 [Limisphaerales bacterium]
MIDPATFKNLRLRGGFTITDVEFTSEPIMDALNREALAQTRINGTRFHIRLQAGMSEQEISICPYHEVLEAATVASLRPPDSVIKFNEGDFERAAQTAHAQFGSVTPTSLNHLLQSYGFQGE